MFTVEQIQLIFEALNEKHGKGWSSDPKVAAVQAKLSIMLEMAAKREFQEEERV